MLMLLLMLLLLMLMLMLKHVFFLDDATHRSRCQKEAGLTWTAQD
jgi:hypothetical protein